MSINNINITTAESVNQNYICIIKYTEECQWVGKLPDLVQHVEEKHCECLINISAAEAKTAFVVCSFKPKLLVRQILGSKLGYEVYFVQLFESNGFNKIQFIHLGHVGNENDKSLPIKKYSVTEYFTRAPYLAKTLIANTIPACDECSLTESLALGNERCAEGQKYLIRIDELQKTLEDELVKELECIACKKIIEPPIRMCKNGHSNGSCGEKIGKCIICQCKLTRIRNHSLEKVLEIVTKYKTDEAVVECQYIDEGCYVRAAESVIKIHEKTCVFGPAACIYQDLTIACNWRGSQNDLLVHIRRDHSRSIRKVGEFCSGMTVDQTYFYFIEGNCFAFHSLLLVPNYLFTIYHLTRRDVCLFTFHMEFRSQDETMFKSLRGLCKPVEGKNFYQRYTLRNAKDYHSIETPWMRRWLMHPNESFTMAMNIN